MNLSFINTLRQYLKILNEAPVEQISLGVVLGMFLGLLPLSINSVIIGFFLMALKTERRSGVLSALLFGLLGGLIDPLAHVLGYWALVQLGFLKPVWTALYNMPLMAFSGFNNTIVMGNTLLGLLLIVPLTVVVKKGLVRYRATGFAAWAAEHLADNKKLGNLFNLFKGFNLFNKFKGQ